MHCFLPLVASSMAVLHVCHFYPSIYISSSPWQYCFTMTAWDIMDPTNNFKDTFYILLSVPTSSAPDLQPYEALNMHIKQIHLLPEHGNLQSDFSQGQVQYMISRKHPICSCNYNCAHEIWAISFNLVKIPVCSDVREKWRKTSLLLNKAEDASCWKKKSLGSAGFVAAGSFTSIRYPISQYSPSLMMNNLARYTLHWSARGEISVTNEMGMTMNLRPLRKESKL